MSLVVEHNKVHDLPQKDAGPPPVSTWPMSMWTEILFTKKIPICLSGPVPVILVLWYCPPSIQSMASCYCFELSMHPKVVQRFLARFWI